MEVQSDSGTVNLSERSIVLSNFMSYAGSCVSRAFDQDSTRRETKIRVRFQSDQSRKRDVPDRCLVVQGFVIIHPNAVCESRILHQIFLDRGEVFRMSCVNSLVPIRVERFHCDPDQWSDSTAILKLKRAWSWSATTRSL